jgi:hypothetical protein
MALTAEVIQQIATQTLTETAPQQIVTNFRTQDNEENPLFKARDIYNQRELISQELREI